MKSIRRKTICFMFLIFLIDPVFLLENPPNQYFLTHDEIVKSRGNIERNNIKDYTENNQVEFIIEGSNFMKALYEDLEATEKGDFIHGTSFEEILGIMLLPDANKLEEARKTSILNVLTRAVNRGVKLRYLASTNVLEFYNSLPWCIALNRACGYICCGSETRHTNFFGGSIHTKMWVIQRKGEVVAYNGGIDISNGRWDTNKHDYTKENQLNGQFFKFSAYHDTMMRIRGPAVADYERHFHQSWNDPYPVFFPFGLLPKYEYVEPKYATFDSGLQVQVIRTISCKGSEVGYYSNYAPKGEFSGSEAFRKLLKNAKRYVYMVDQFFNFGEAVDMIVQELPRLEAVVILTNEQQGLMQEERVYMQYKALIKLMSNEELKKKVHIFRLVRDTNTKEQLYTHEKTYIADDDFMITGSMGVERAGFTADQEVSAALYDPQGKFVKEQRKRLWSEHLNLPMDDPRIDDFMEGVKEWHRQADAQSYRVRNHFPRNIRKPILTELFKRAFETEGRCDRY